MGGLGVSACGSLSEDRRAEYDKGTAKEHCIMIAVGYDRNGHYAKVIAV